ncbi:MAG: DUF2924 domain-containing protein [Aureliella sp.]
MSNPLGQELAALRRMSVSSLQTKYIEVFGESTTGRNKAWLQKRIAWRLQANAFGGLSDRAIQRAGELANESDLRVMAPREPSRLPPPPPMNLDLPPKDERIPPVGDCLVRIYKGREYVVTIMPNGFDFEGEYYKTLSAIAKKITGQHWNGFRFFDLKKKESK